MKKRIRKIIIISLIAVLFLDGIIIAISSYVTSRDKEWGILLSATNVSSTGLTLTLERKDSKKEEILYYDHDYWLQKRTLFGWKYLDTVSGDGILQVGTGHYIDKGDAETWNVNWENSFGKLWPGIYRINCDCSTEDSRKYSEKERKEQNLEPKLYATFTVIF